MPSADNMKQIFSFASLVILFLSLGAAGTSLGLLQANTNNGVYAICHFFISYSQAMDSDLINYNVPTCKLSIASATIAIICLALLTAIELISVSFKIYVKTLIAKILQVVIFVGSILFLLITMIVVSAGWGKTCATYKNITSSGGTPSSLFNIDCTGPQYIYGSRAGWGKTCATYKNITSSGGTPSSLFNIDCTGPQYIYGSRGSPFPPNGAEIITAAVFAGVGALFAAGALCVYIAQQQYIRSNDESFFSRELSTNMESNDNDD
uniref:MARVEL domain-containing protein n=1 Tax=Amphimedon queenslandica TaxID=400682 RepID=A0A1X7U3P9_AMPQE